jgi:hypothetical protein
MGSRREITLFTAGYSVTAAFAHRGKAPHVETRAERAALAGQYYRPQSLLAGEPPGGLDQRLEHRGIERVHLVRPNQADIGNTFRDRDLDAFIHQNSPPQFFAGPLYTKAS